MARRLRSTPEISAGGVLRPFRRQRQAGDIPGVLGVGET
jgi:hypothetical protein